MDLGQKIHLIQHNFDIGAYTIVAKECVGLIEQAFRQLFSRGLTQLDEKDRLAVQKAELEIGKGEKGIESFTMGQLVGIFRTSHFLEAWARISGKELNSIRMINLNELNNLRNKLIHDGREATRAEAELLLNCLHVILETFDLVRADDDTTRIFTPVVEHEFAIEPHYQTAIPQQLEGPVPVAELVSGAEVKTLVIEPGAMTFPGKLASHIYLLQAIALGFFLFLLFFIPHLDVLELKALDWKFKTRQWYDTYKNKGQITIKKEKVIIITLGDDFLEGDTISRKKLASFIHDLSAKKPKVVGLDVLLDTRKKGDGELIQAIKKAGNVIIPFELRRTNPQKRAEMILPLPEFSDETKVGFANFSKNPIDGIVRDLQPLKIGEEDRIYYPFTLQILRSFYAGKEIEEILRGNPEKLNSLRINFEGEDQFIILQPDDLEGGVFKDFYYEDKIVLIGYVGEKQPHDRFLTPLSVGKNKIRGIFVQASILNTINREEYIRSWTSLSAIVVLLFACSGAYLSARVRWIHTLLIVSFTWIGYVIVVQSLFLAGIDIPLWAPMLTFTLTSVIKGTKVISHL
ncbi:MAG: CHASE2 domain-containing protein [bacterium]|nr:CHASE2 domain-containing protein [bacterium]